MSVFAGYNGDAMRRCFCGGWFGPTEVSRKAHRTVHGHWPREPEVTPSETPGQPDSDIEPDDRTQS